MEKLHSPDCSTIIEILQKQTLLVILFVYYLILYSYETFYFTNFEEILYFIELRCICRNYKLLDRLFLRLPKTRVLYFIFQVFREICVFKEFELPINFEKFIVIIGFDSKTLIVLVVIAYYRFIFLDLGFYFLDIIFG